MTYIACLIIFSAIVGALYLAYTFARDFRRAWRDECHARRRRNWPSHGGHSDHFFRDVKRGWFPEDLN